MPYVSNLNEFNRNKGGRPKNPIVLRTRQEVQERARELMPVIIDKTIKIRQNIKNLKVLCDGVLVAKVDGRNGKESVYKVPPNLDAIKFAEEQRAGKAAATSGGTHIIILDLRSTGTAHAAPIENAEAEVLPPDAP